MIPVCLRCDDTHRMTWGEEGSEHEVPCTGCPVPCQACRAGGFGAFCEKTPCACECHRGSKWQESKKVPECGAHCEHVHGDQADPEDLELSRLRAEVERLKERLAFKEAERKHLAAIIKERDAMLFAAYGFCEEVDRAEAHANRPRGGQHVPPSGDFVHAQPSILGRLKWWARAFKDAGGNVEYAVKTLTAEVEGARAEAAAAKRERDVERNQANEWLAQLHDARRVNDQLVAALKRAADAINEDEGWHDEQADEDGNETCEPGDPCSCELVRMVNDALSDAAAIRARGQG